MTDAPEFVIAKANENAPAGQTFFTGQIELVEDADGNSSGIAQTAFFIPDAFKFSKFEDAAMWAALLDPFHDLFFVAVIVPGAEPVAVPVAVMPPEWGQEPAEQSGA